MTTCGKGSAVIDALTQQEPNEGAPASEPSEMRILYDTRHLFIEQQIFEEGEGHRRVNNSN